MSKYRIHSVRVRETALHLDIFRQSGLSELLYHLSSLRCSCFRRLRIYCPFAAAAPCCRCDGLQAHAIKTTRGAADDLASWVPSSSSIAFSDASALHATVGWLSTPFSGASCSCKSGTVLRREWPCSARIFQALHGGCSPSYHGGVRHVRRRSILAAYG